jgi:phosphoglycolate phosphatase
MHSEYSFTPRLIVFDLDGTLIDSRVDLCNSVNATLAHLGRPALPADIIADYIGDGVAMLVRRALLHSDKSADETRVAVEMATALPFFLDFYRAHKLDHTYVYPGVIDALEDLHATQPAALMAVLTNKPVRPSRDICAHFRLDRFFFQNYGGNSFPTKKPDPQGLLALIGEAGTTPADTVMIGDSSVDILTARNCGARAIGCTFGLAPDTLTSPLPDALVHTPTGWPTAIQTMPEFGSDSSKHLLH